MSTIEYTMNEEHLQKKNEELDRINTEETTMTENKAFYYISGQSPACLGELMPELARLRAEIALQQGIVNTAATAAHATREAKILATERVTLAELKAVEASKTAFIKKLAQDVYATTTNKHPHAGISIRLNKKLLITDQAAALEWATTAALDLVKTTLDKRKLKKVAGVMAVPGVELIDAPAVLINKNLSTYLGEVPF